MHNGKGLSSLKAEGTLGAALLLLKATRCLYRVAFAAKNLISENHQK